MRQAHHERTSGWSTPGQAEGHRGTHCREQQRPKEDSIGDRQLPRNSQTLSWNESLQRHPKEDQADEERNEGRSGSRQEPT